MGTSDKYPSPYIAPIPASLTPFPSPYCDSKSLLYTQSSHAAERVIQVVFEVRFASVSKPYFASDASSADRKKTFSPFKSLP